MTDSASRSLPADVAFGLLGAAIGGALGYFLFGVLIRQGFYAPLLPGAMVGLGGGALSGRYSKLIGGLCALIGLGLGIVTVWRFMPFVADDSFGFFITHLHKLSGLTKITLLLGAGLGYWLGVGRPGGAWLRRG